MLPTLAGSPTASNPDAPWKDEPGAADWASQQLMPMELQLCRADGSHDDL